MIVCQRSLRKKKSYFLAYIFVLAHIAPYICENLDRVKQTTISCAVIEREIEEIKPSLVREELNVSSIRVDSVLARLYHLSRSAAQELVAGGNLLVNGRSVLSISYEPKEGDVLTVRGYGKLIYRGPEHETKKGRLVVSVDRYI